MVADIRSLDTKRSWEWLRFVAGLPARPYQYSGLTGTLQQLTGRFILTGVTINNTGTVAGILSLYDGQDANGELIIPQHFSASGTVTANMPGMGVLCDNGVFMSTSAGTLSGAVFAIALSEYNITIPGH